MKSKRISNPTHVIAWLNDGGLAHVVLYGRVSESRKAISKEVYAFVKDCGLASSPMPPGMFPAFQNDATVIAVSVLGGVYYGQV